MGLCGFSLMGRVNQSALMYVRKSLSLSIVLVAHLTFFQQNIIIDWRDVKTAFLIIWFGSITPQQGSRKKETTKKTFRWLFKSGFIPFCELKGYFG